MWVPVSSTSKKKKKKSFPTYMFGWSGGKMRLLWEGRKFFRLVEEKSGRINVVYINWLLCHCYMIYKWEDRKNLVFPNICLVGRVKKWL